MIPFTPGMVSVCGGVIVYSKNVRLGGWRRASMGAFHIPTSIKQMRKKGVMACHLGICLWLSNFVNCDRVLLWIWGDIPGLIYKSFFVRTSPYWVKSLVFARAQSQKCTWANCDARALWFLISSCWMGNSITNMADIPPSMLPLY